MNNKKEKIGKNQHGTWKALAKNCTFVIMIESHYIDWQ